LAGLRLAAEARKSTADGGDVVIDRRQDLIFVLRVAVSDQRRNRKRIKQPSYVVLEVWSAA
jgi:hypothetical protein